MRARGNFTTWNVVNACQISLIIHVFSESRTWDFFLCLIVKNELSFWFQVSSQIRLTTEENKVGFPYIFKHFKKSKNYKIRSNIKFPRPILTELLFLKNHGVGRHPPRWCLPWFLPPPLIHVLSRATSANVHFANSWIQTGRNHAR